MTSDLRLLQKAVEDNPLEDAPLAALVDALQEAGMEWEALVWKHELESRRAEPDTSRWVLWRKSTRFMLRLGPERLLQFALLKDESQEEVSGG